MEFSESCEGGFGNSWNVGGGRDPDLFPPGCSLLYAGPWALAFTLAIRLLRSQDEFLGGREVSKT